jgi:hypothetical protein
VTPEEFKKLVQWDSYDPELEDDELDKGTPTTPLAAQKRTRERFHAKMPRINFDDQSPIFRPDERYNGIVERGMLSATSSKLRHLRPFQKDDVHQETWLYLLEKPMRLPLVATAKELFDLAYYTALRQYNYLHRDDPDAKPLVASNMKLPTLGEDEESEVIPPWDLEIETGRPVHNLTDSEVASLNEGFTKDMLATLKKDDRIFLTRYLRKSSKHSPAQRKRAERLRKKLQTAAAKGESQFIT